jgi:hypothetical protein
MLNFWGYVIVGLQDTALCVLKSLLRMGISLQSCDEEHHFSGENLGVKLFAANDFSLEDRLRTLTEER